MLHTHIYIYICVCMCAAYADGAIENEIYDNAVVECENALMQTTNAESNNETVAGEQEAAVMSEMPCELENALMQTTNAESNDETVAGEQEAAVMSEMPCELENALESDAVPEMNESAEDESVLIDVPNELLLGMGELRKFEIEIRKTDGAECEAEWSVAFEPAGIVSYSGGYLTAEQIGETVMIVSVGNQTEKCTVAVRPYHEVYEAQAVAHRGAAGYWPENTLEAFRNAASTGADMIELDVHTSADGILIVHHDSTIQIGKRKYEISRCTFEELRAIKPEICALEEALVVIKDQDINIQIELKNGADGAACVGAVHRHQMESRTMYISFYEDALKAVRAADDHADIGLLVSGEKLPKADKISETVDDINIGAILPSQKLIAESAVLSWHKLGLKVGVWTVNTSEMMGNLIQMGVDYITSDFPDLIVNY